MITLTGKALSTQNLYGYTCRGKFARKYMKADGVTVKKSYIEDVEDSYPNLFWFESAAEKEKADENYASIKDIAANG